MMHSILLTLLATATLPSPALPPAPARVRPADPVIKIWTDWEEYSRGQTASAHLRTREDGYVIVLQADVDGRVRVVFPLDPGDDNFVRGGHDIALAGRGGKGSFYIDGPPGMAAVYAAVSAVPFRFTDFVKGDHWDYAAIYDKSLESDFESGFTAIVDRMSAGHFDYDIYRYRVEGQGSYTSADSYTGPTYIGSPCWVAPYDAFCGGPTYIPGPFYGAAYPYGYGYGPSLGFGYSMGYGFGFGVSFGFPYYGYGYGDPYYGYGYGYPYYGYGYPGYGYGSFYYPYYGGGYYHGYNGGYPYTPVYSPKPGSPGGAGGIGVGYRPRAGAPGTTGGTGIGYRGSTGTPGTQTGGLGVPTARSPGWTLGRPGASRPSGGSGPRRNDGGYSGGRSDGNGGQPAARAPRGDAPPRYEPGSRAEPRGRSAPSGGGAAGGAPARGPSSAPQGGGSRPPSSGSPAGRAPSAPAPRSAPSAPASRPSSPPSHGGGGGGHRVP